MKCSKDDCALYEGHRGNCDNGNAGEFNKQMKEPTIRKIGPSSYVLEVNETTIAYVDRVEYTTIGKPDRWIIAETNEDHLDLLGFVNALTLPLNGEDS